MSRRLLIKGFLGITTGVSGGVALVASYDEGTKRSLQFWSNVFPIYVHYRTVQFLNEDLGVLNKVDAMNYYDTLHLKYTDFVKNVTYKMRGFYLKQAQLMSTQDDFVPPAYMAWVKDTQDNVPSEFSGDGAKLFCASMLQKELGLKFDEVFSEWDDKPLGVASIGQVHKARLRSTGAVVAVKLQLPGIERTFRADIATLKGFCWLAMPQHLSAFNEIEKQFCTEFDYHREAENLQKCRDVVMPKWGRQVVIPKPYLQFCSKHVLVMEFLNGVKLVDGVKAQFTRLAASRGLSLHKLEAERKAAVKDGRMEFKSLNEAAKEQEKLKWMIWLSDSFLTLNPLRVCYNISPLVLVTGPAKYHRTEPPLDLGHLLSVLCRVHGAQIFQDGVFNADPHPGNILLLDDGRLGLIDYGQVKTMAVPDRVKYAKLILAHLRDDHDEIVRIQVEEMGLITAQQKKDITYLLSCFWNDRITKDIVGKHNIATFIDWLESQDKMICLPEQFIMAARVSILLRGMGNAFGLQLRMSEMWSEDAISFLREQGIEY